MVGQWGHTEAHHHRMSNLPRSTSFFEDTRIQWDPISQPSGTLGMIALVLRLDRIGMDQSTQRAPIDDQPGNKGAELCGCEEVHFEHGHWVRANRFVPETVDS